MERTIPRTAIFFTPRTQIGARSGVTAIAPVTSAWPRSSGQRRFSVGWTRNSRRDRGSAKEPRWAGRGDHAWKRGFARQLRRHAGSGA